MAQSSQFVKTQYGPESSTYGTETGSYAVLPRVQSCNIESENGLIYDYGLGEGLNATNTYYGPFTANGAVTFNPTDFDFLKHWVGHKSGAGTSGDKYTLTEATSIEAASAATGKLIPFSIERVNDDGTDTVDFALGCVGTDFSLSGSIGSKLECTANFIAQKSGHRASGESYTADTSSAFIMINGTWSWGASPSALSGVRQFSISMNNNITAENTRTIESRFIGIPVFGIREYKFSVQILMAQSLAATIINDFYGYESSGTYTPEDGSNTTSPTSSLEFSVDFVNGDNYASIELDECSIDRISKPAEVGGGVVVLTFEGTARKGLGNAPIKWWSV